MVVGMIMGSVLGLGALSGLLLYIVLRRKSTRMALERQEENLGSTYSSGPGILEKGNAPSQSTGRPKIYGGNYELPTGNVI